jgi:hypothetical protein
MDDIAKIIDLTKYKKPDEIEKIKQYVMDKYSKVVEVVVRPEMIVISCSSAGLVNDLRLNAKNLVDSCDLGDKKISFKIS